MGQPLADSFSHGAREEIAHKDFAPCCGRALLAALMALARNYKSHGFAIRLNSASAARLAISLLKREKLGFAWKKLSSSYIISFLDKPSFEAKKMGRCCRRAFVAGCFLCCGSVSSPRRGYHMEWAADDKVSVEISEILAGEGLSALVSLRRGAHVVILKRADDICSALSFMGATQARLAFEEARALKETKGDIKRRVNAETANLGRASEASARQLALVRRLAQISSLSDLPGALGDLARCRLENPDMSFRELGELMSPPISRQAVGRKFSQMEKFAEKAGIVIPGK
ncbi:MAG: DNA-binding protein WhiA [bacterium]|nr:DNA-binding protein WhiA [bacterium]